MADVDAEGVAAVVGLVSINNLKFFVFLEKMLCCSSSCGKKLC